MAKEVDYKINISGVDARELETKIKELDEVVEKARSIMEDLANREFSITVIPTIQS